VLSLTDEEDTPQTPAEMRPLVDESHRLRKKVGSAIATVIRRDAKRSRLGSDSIEHGSFFKPENADIDEKQGTF